MSRLMWDMLMDIKICFFFVLSYAFWISWKTSCIQVFILQKDIGKLPSLAVPRILMRDDKRKFSLCC